MRTRHHLPQGFSADSFDSLRGEKRRGRGGRGHGFGPGFGPGFDAGFGPGFGPGRRGGPGRARRGDVRTAILSQLRESEYNGYGLMKTIAERTNGLWRPSPGSVYPALAALEDEGLIEATGEGRRSDYRLTDAGRSYTAEREAELEAVWEELDAESGGHHDAVRDLRESIAKLMGAVQQIAMDGTEEQLAKVQEDLDATRRKIYQLLAE
ncbi:PadR family transcriptional regulator [Acaricomes phytoseiuli]|uniref:PadR family transcriptional regulator n=1 Tax=Acaricomes phytoseiuli TaxID=291968 RepID=UPI00036DC5CD|nr:PadR family transcriptional regulator [Acaricomes phytoseiuli]MCW1250429.1 PadR family transcriptional regulator [Acaricomes phytoseiuli]